MFKRTNKYTTYRTNTLKLISKECRYMREKRGIKQSEIAKALGVHQSQISQFELGLNDSAVIYFYYQEFIYPTFIEFKE